MALVWIKDPDRIIREGGGSINIYNYNEFYDERVSDSFVEGMYELVRENGGPFSCSFYREKDFSIPKQVGFSYYQWYRPWIKMILPDGFKIKRRI